MLVMPEIQGPMLDLFGQAMRDMAKVKDGLAFYARCEAGKVTPEELAKRQVDQQGLRPDRPYATILAGIYAEYPTRESFDAAMRHMGRKAREHHEWLHARFTMPRIRDTPA